VWSRLQLESGRWGALPAQAAQLRSAKRTTQVYGVHERASSIAQSDLPMPGKEDV
jgi:hypothetical protein